MLRRNTDNIHKSIWNWIFIFIYKWNNAMQTYLLYEKALSYDTKKSAKMKNHLEKIHSEKKKSWFFKDATRKI